MNEDPRTIIGRRLKDAREYLNLSQEEAASFAKISRSAISLIENGQRKLDSVELMNLAKLYQKPIAYFTEENFSVEPNPMAAVLARSLSTLSENDQKELQQFAEFLVMRSKG